MRFSDIISMSVSNLWKRKVRTILTVLGVVVGTASIVVMLSLGIGLQSAMLGQIQSQISMTDIQVYNWSAENGSQQQLTDDKVTEFEQLEHVKMVSPILSVNANMTQGKYQSWVQIYGVTQEYMAQIPLAEGGRIPTANSNKLELLVGNSVPSNFYNPASTSDLTDSGDPVVDMMNKTVFTQFDSTWTTDSEGNSVEQPARKNIFPIVGMVDGGTDSYNSYSYNVYADIDSLKKYLKENYRGQAIPGQPTDKSGNPYKYFCYDQVIVSVDDIDNVEDVKNQISEMGYQCYSESEWIKQAQQEMLIIEAVLGGIGAISLLVAAIGIANTMTMSIYERTKEIGVMKVLGCSLGNIRMMFLTEAAFIGFIGGVIGLIISYILSFVCNLFLPALVGYEGQNISVIPFWLVLVAIAFSTLIGMLAGFFPAQRATKLSPLAAIRNE